MALFLKYKGSQKSLDFESFYLNFINFSTIF